MLEKHTPPPASSSPDSAFTPGESTLSPKALPPLPWVNHAHPDEIADSLGESLVNEIYMFMFHHRECRPQDIRDAGFDPELIAPTLAVLEARGLVTCNDDNQWFVVPPARSFPPLAARLEERARLLRTSLPGLSAAYRSAANGADDLHVHGIEHLSTPEDVSFAMAQCYVQAESRVRSMVRDSLASRKGTHATLPALREGRIGVAQRVLDSTTVLDTSLIRDMDAVDLDWCEHLPHEHLLLSNRVPATVVVNDSGMAVIESSVDGVTDGLLITHPQLVQAISAVVDLVMEHSSGWNRTGEHDERNNLLSTSEQEILRMLGLGIPDATIARRLGISPRTFDRRLRSIMDALGAVTRFQAGALAHHRGWL